MLTFFNTLLSSLVPPAVLVAGGIFMVSFFRRREGVCQKSVPHGAGASPASSFRALALALAGTLGVGNIVGVASAVALGGPGAVFWMWVSAIFAMFLKYAEVVLAIKHRRTRPDGSHYGGAPYYFRAVVGHRHPPAGVVASALFAVLLVANALSMGCVLQSGAVAGALDAAFSVPPIVTGAALALLCPLLLLRGRRAVSVLCGFLVPTMTGVFLLMALAALGARREAVLPALASILDGAFSPSAAGGGLLGFLSSRAVRYGTLRGLISNEAGCGTSPTAHAGAEGTTPHHQGLFGMLEVAVDTLVLCTLAALVVLVGGASFDGDPMAMVTSAFVNCLGGAPGTVPLLALSIACFGLATLVCWGQYGAEAVSYLASLLRVIGRKKSAPLLTRLPLYPVLFGLTSLVGTLATPAVLWSITDLVTSLMTLSNVAVLLAARRQSARR